MANYSATIRQFLLSHLKSEYNSEPVGFGTNDTDIYGNYYHPNEVIKKTYKKLFEKMSLKEHIKDDFKIEFCKKFYNQEIGFEVFAPFLTALEATLNNECYNLFKMLDLTRNMTKEDMLKTSHYKHSGSAKSNNNNIQLQQTTPEKDMNIIYPDDSGVIKYADMIAEGRGKGDQETKSESIGYSNRSQFEMYNYYAQMEDLQNQIFNICSKLFLQIL